MTSCLRWQQLIERLEQVPSAQTGLFLLRLPKGNNLRVRIDQDKCFALRHEHCAGAAIGENLCEQGIARSTAENVSTVHAAPE